MSRIYPFFFATCLAINSGCGVTRHKNNDEDKAPEKPQTPYQLFDARYTDLIDSSDYLKTVRISPDNKMFATAGLDGKIRVYDLATQKALHILETHNNFVDHIAFTKDSQHIISSSPDKTIRIYDLNQMGDHEFNHHAVESKRIQLSSDVRDFSLSPDETKLIAVVYGQGLVLVNIATAAVELTIKTPMKPYTTPTENPFYSVVFLPDGKSVISGNDLGIHQWDLTTGNELREFKWVDDSISYVPDIYMVKQIALSSDGSKLVANFGLNRSYLVWDLASGNQVNIFDRFTASTPTPGSYQSDYKMELCLVAKFSRDGSKLIGGAADELRVWDVATRKELYRFTGSEVTSHLIYDFDVSSDGKFLIHTNDKGVRLWPLDGQL